MDHDIDLKIILLGESQAGKTCITKRVVFDSFEEQGPRTFGVSYCNKDYETREHQKYRFGFWDTAGEEEYDSLSTFYCRNAGCVLIVYDVTSRASFEGLARFIPKIPEAKPDAFLFLIATKIDLVKINPDARKITQEEGIQKAKALNAVFLEVSAKTGENIAILWESIGSRFEKVMAKVPKQIDATKKRIRLKKDANLKKKKKKCC
ncbi:rab gtpase [Anaeramoeba ignava]|uniref:Rab gtpase n=1 Tax=Anaeramoeba ignava TaxID=1746090 RepID=A0A9Q0LNZ3_ANAIG|nr:rab gtpase [Anaeramoeba ignava]|eukprot:Anaeramoba_ignava/a486212_77.p1 GENE.a486212_77~~a486212_77.p1  ORF type:complete len:206 (-),score=66.41 a486212_77:46-663(-)